MAREINFAALDEAADKVADERVQRWSRREPNPTVQMSIRLPAETYDRFRALCLKERYTNGDQLRVLLDHYLKTANKKD